MLHHVAPRTGGCHRRLVTGTVAVHMLLVVVIQPPCRCSDSPRVQQYGYNSLVQMMIWLAYLSKTCLVCSYCSFASDLALHCLSLHEQLPGRGGGGERERDGYSHFFFIRSGPASKISGISSTPKIYEILATPKKYPSFCNLTLTCLRKGPKMHRNEP